MAIPGFRSGRGFTFNYLAMAITVIPSKLNRIKMSLAANPTRVSADQARHLACRKAVPLIVGEGSRKNSQGASIAFPLHNEKGPVLLFSRAGLFSAIS